MSIVNMVSHIKQVHPNFVVLVENGTFCHLYGKDAYIIAYLFNYKTKIVNDNLPTCGFPVASKAKIIAKLEEKKINYLFLDPKNNYEVNEKTDYQNLNNYDMVYAKAQIFIKNRKIYEKLMSDLKKIINKENFLEKARKIQKIINEG